MESSFERPHTSGLFLISIKNIANTTLKYKFLSIFNFTVM